MKFRSMALVAVIVSVLALATAWAQTRKADAQIKQDMIAASIAAYRGSCPCPYNRDRAGRSCGKRSAYSRPGGASPLCDENDITQKMVDDYRKRTGQ
jgi:hypothetical protein